MITPYRSLLMSIGLHSAFSIAAWLAITFPNSFNTPRSGVLSVSIDRPQSKALPTSNPTGVKTRTQNNPSRSASDFSENVGISTGEQVVRAQGLSIESDFLSQLMERVNAAKRYPRYSIVRRETGEVKVGFTVLLDGTIQDVRVVQPSSFPALNEAAVDAIRRIKKAAPIPQELHRSRWEIVLPMRFEIKSS